MAYEAPEEEGPIALPPPRHRTVMDCNDEISLRWALSMEPPPPSSAAVASAASNSNNNNGSEPLNNKGYIDWHTPHLCPLSSHPQSLNEEVKRLMLLKEYSILDSDHEEKFERITALASRVFDVPICLVSLVDIGRQWFMSNRGLGDVRETSRQVSFCAHAIQSKEEDIFVIPETLADARFVNNGLVTGPPYIRFYAGVPLTAPEGHKLGTLCIIDTKPRPEGLTLKEKQNLRELTAMALDTMVQRKLEMKRIRDEKTRLIACAAHDLMSPLTGIQLNLGLLLEESTKLNGHQQDLIHSSLRCSEIIERICKTAIESFRGEMVTDAATETGINDGGVLSEKGVVTIEDLVKNVDRVVAMYPKKVPLFMDVNENVPAAILSDDLKLFRSILNYLTNACKHTQKGSIHLRIYTRKAASETYSNGGLGGLPGSLMTPLTDVLVVECEDTGPGIELDKLATLFQPLSDVESSVAYHNKMHNSGLGLYSVANEISSLGGNYGVFPREDLNSSPGSLDHDPISGTVFWFTVPLVEPASRRVSSMGDTDEGLLEPLNGGIKYALAGAKIHDSLSSMSSMESISRPKRPLNKSNMVFPIAKRRQMGHNNISRHRNSPSSHHKHTQPCPEVPSPPMPSSQKPGERSKCVLVIDDSITIRKALSKGFSRLGFKVDEAENGLQGFNLMKAHPYDLVLCDFLMPIMDGIDVAKKIRAWERMSRPWYHQQIVGLSAHANGKDAEVGLKAGMDRFMSKPIPVKTLKDLTSCKQVVDAGHLLDSRFEESFDAMEASFSKCADSVSGSMRSDSSSSDKATKPSCLLVENKPDDGVHSLQRFVELNGWKSVVVTSGEDALRLLKMRNWGLVIIDNDLPFGSGIDCIARFRDWETHNCIAKQQNIYIMSDRYNPLSVPTGFDGALRRPFDASQVVNALERARHFESSDVNIQE